MRFLSWCCLLTVFFLPASVASAQGSTSNDAADLSYCQILAIQYDRYSSYAEGMSADGRIDRMSGEQLCRQGNFAEGQRLLKAAIERLGFAPLERPPKAGS